MRRGIRLMAPKAAPAHPKAFCWASLAIARQGYICCRFQRSIHPVGLRHPTVLHVAGQIGWATISTPEQQALDCVCKPVM